MIALLMVPSIHVTKKERPSKDHAAEAMTATVAENVWLVSRM